MDEQIAAFNSTTSQLNTTTKAILPFKTAELEAGN